MLVWIGLTCMTIRESQTWWKVASKASQKRHWGFQLALFWATCLGESHHRPWGHSGSFLERSTWWATEASCQQPALTWQLRAVAEITWKWPFSPRQPSDAQRRSVSWLWPHEIPWDAMSQDQVTDRFGSTETVCDKKCSLFESESEVAQLCPTLCNPMGCSLPGSSVYGIF